MRVMVTGGAGFVGSHTTVALIEAGHEAVVVDTLVNSHGSMLDGIEHITGKKPRLYQVDVGDPTAFEPVVRESDVEAVLHLAAYKAVGESVEQPLRYYDNNVGGTIRMLEVLVRNGISNLVFSSSATVYGSAEILPVTEESPTGRATNPYGWTKIMMEQVLTDLQAAEEGWSMTILRYFNPVGAHPTAHLGEEPIGVPSNLMPYVTQVAAGRYPHLRVFGTDYPTADGTAIRDYVHVVDVALGHVAAVEQLSGKSGLHVFNLGTGRGSSVLDVVRAFVEATGVEILWEPYPRRAGDVALSYASVDKAAAELGWTANLSLEAMCADSWRWQQTIETRARSAEH
jgi:UDP-glucose 4-epimerase